MVSVVLVLALSMQPPPDVSASTRAEAYAAFLEARRKEAVGDAAGAAAALEHAATLDASPAILTELGQVYARQDRPDAARDAARRALELDPEFPDAHWLLGMLSIPSAAMDGNAGARDRTSIETAITHLEKAVDGRSYDLNLRVVLGRLYLQVDRPADAARALRSVWEQDSGSLEAGALFAQALERSQARDEALDVLEQVLEDEPRFFRARILQAEILERSRRFADAAEAYRLAALESPDNVELRLRQASALLNADRAEDARAVLTALVASHPTDLQARYLLAQAQRELGDGEAAEATAKELMSIAPADVRGPVILSQLYADRGDHAKVVEVLTPLVNGNGVANATSSLGVTLRLANAHMALGQADEAIAVVERARQARPGASLDAYLLQTLVMARRWDRAIEIGREIRQVRPDDLQVARMLTQALAGARRADEAVSLLNELEPRMRDQVNYWFERGAVFERLERRSDAKASFRQALAIEPRHAPTLNYLGYMLVEDNEQLPEAERMIQEALAVDPDNGSYLDSLGWACFKQGKLTEARTHLERAARLSSGNSVIQDHLGDVLLALDDRSGAIAAWERALAGDGDDIDHDAIRAKISRARQRE